MMASMRRLPSFLALVAMLSGSTAVSVLATATLSQTGPGIGSSPTIGLGVAPARTINLAPDSANQSMALAINPPSGRSLEGADSVAIVHSRPASRVSDAITPSDVPGEPRPASRSEVPLSLSGHGSERADLRCRHQPKQSHCGALSVTPIGRFLVARALMPGGSMSTLVEIVVTGKAAQRVSLAAKGLTFRTCVDDGFKCGPGQGTGNLTHTLQLRVLDITTGLTLFSRLLSQLPLSPRGLTVCNASSTATHGHGCGGRWHVGEHHTLQLTIRFVTHGRRDNNYQGTGASVRLVWTRST
jgi:hypothetical protein